MKRVLILGGLSLTTISLLAFLIFSMWLILLPAPRPPVPPWLGRPGETVTAQQVTDHFGFPIIHPSDRGPVLEVRLHCWTERNMERCDFRLYYADNYSLEVIPFAPYSQLGADWQQDLLAEDPRGIYRLITVRGQSGIGRIQGLPSETYPEGWPAMVMWYDPEKRWFITLVGQYDLQTLLGITNGPWCTVATPADIEPTLPFC